MTKNSNQGYCLNLFMLFFYGVSIGLEIFAFFLKFSVKLIVKPTAHKALGLRQQNFFKLKTLEKFTRRKMRTDGT